MRPKEVPVGRPEEVPVGRPEGIALDQITAELVIAEHNGAQAVTRVSRHSLAHLIELGGVHTHPLMHETRVEPARPMSRGRVAVVEQCEHGVAFVPHHEYRQLQTAINRRSSSPDRTSSCFAGYV